MPRQSNAPPFLGFVLHDGRVIAPLRASTPHGSWESAMNEATSGLTSAAFVVQQPAEVDVNEIVIRPAAQV